MFITTLGCDRVLGNGHINIDEGIFGILEEKLAQIRTGHIIPARDNTSCKCRRTAKCNIDCKNAIHVIVSGYKFVTRNIGKRI